ncbi:hypothetical protein JTE90_000235 [Oedothorax gibbosus]|uniref:Uncharacterized protein n=1 Tax=Oedothorax gibbosus TaxID=931172 RepID=A0AAV6VAB9_9ARAC|nr:hypothetical protein JTE90_000235 [Oedothorax gibbosus]
MSSSWTLIILFSSVVLNSISGEDVSSNSRENKGRSGRGLGEIKYGAPEKISNFPSAAAKSDASRIDNIPPTFSDFVPNQNAGYYYKSQSKKGDDFKGYTDITDFQTPWMFPPVTDMASFLKSTKEVEDAKPQGLLDQMLDGRNEIILGLLIPFSILLAAALPPIINYFLKSYSTDFPVITTTATGNRGRRLLNIDPSLIASVLETIESFSQKFSE